MAKSKGKKRLRVLVRLSMRGKAGRAMTTGILRYAATHPQFEMNIAEKGNDSDIIFDYGDWRPDGVIMHAREAGDNVVAGARAAVFLHSDPPRSWRGRPCGAIFCDDAAAGRIAASHLLRRNLRHFGYFGSLHRTLWSEARHEAFAEAIRDAGMPEPSVFGIEPPYDLSKQRKALAEWVRGLPKPCGILASSDWPAKQILDICREEDISVPELVQVIGIDNEEYVCEQSVPTLTSIEPDFEGGGYEAMRMLHAMLLGRRVPAKPSLYGIRGIVERRSTRDDRGTARIVNLALDFIHLHATSGATAADAVKAAGCSPSLLQRYFKKALGRTVIQEIQRVRLEKACRLLRHSETPISEIGPLCGYEDEIYFKLLFRRAYGKSMRDYRREARR